MYKLKFMGSDDNSSAGVVLGLGFELAPSKTRNLRPNYDLLGIKAARVLEPSLILSLSGECADESSNFGVKRERAVIVSEEVEKERVCCFRLSTDEDDDGANARKKLRLNKDQSAFLEECFKQHSSLNSKQKEELARKLNLRPRQVEVWFQNRRARTKLKQTEVDYEYLKKYCETLSDENKRLQKEIQYLKSLNLSRPMHVHAASGSYTDHYMCPSCQRTASRGGNNTSKSLFPMPPSIPFSPNPSTACS